MENVTSPTQSTGNSYYNASALEMGIYHTEMTSSSVEKKPFHIKPILEKIKFPAFPESDKLNKIQQLEYLESAETNMPELDLNKYLDIEKDMIILKKSQQKILDNLKDFRNFDDKVEYFKHFQTKDIIEMIDMFFEERRMMYNLEEQILRINDGIVENVEELDYFINHAINSYKYKQKSVGQPIPNNDRFQLNEFTNYYNEHERNKRRAMYISKSPPKRPMQQPNNKKIELEKNLNKDDIDTRNCETQPMQPQNQQQGHQKKKEKLEHSPMFVNNQKLNLVTKENNMEHLENIQKVKNVLDKKHQSKEELHCLIAKTQCLDSKLVYNKYNNTTNMRFKNPFKDLEKSCYETNKHYRLLKQTFCYHRDNAQLNKNFRGKILNSNKTSNVSCFYQLADNLVIDKEPDNSLRKNLEPFNILDKRKGNLSIPRKFLMEGKNVGINNNTNSHSLDVNKVSIDDDLKSHRVEKNFIKLEQMNANDVDNSGSFLMIQNANILNVKPFIKNDFKKQVSNNSYYK